MSDKALIALIAAAGPITGIILSELFGRWRRREEYKRILFNEKFKFYSGLVARTADVFDDLVFRQIDHVPTDYFTDKQNEIMSFNLKHTLIGNNVIRAIVHEFVRACESEKLSLQGKTLLLVEIHKRLCKTCQAELGLNSLAKSIEKLT